MHMSCKVIGTLRLFSILSLWYPSDTWKIGRGIKQLGGDSFFFSDVCLVSRDGSWQVEIYKKKILFSYFVYKYIYESDHKRRYWVHPFNDARYLKGAFNTIFIELREDEQKFFKNIFECLLVHLMNGHHITRHWPPSPPPPIDPLICPSFFGWLQESAMH